MLTQVEISGFKAIKDSGPIKLGPLNLLIGRNGSGKSSLIEALQWLQEAVSEGLREATLRRFTSFQDLVNRRQNLRHGKISLALTHREAKKEVRYALTVKDSPQGPGVLEETCREGRTASAPTTITTTYSVKTGAKAPKLSVRLSREIEGGNPVRDRDALALASVTKTKAVGGERLLEFLRSAVFLRLSPTAMAVPGRLLPRTRGPALDEEGRGLVALLNGLTAAQRQKVANEVSQVITGVEDISVVSQGNVDGYYQTRERMRSRGGSRVFPVPAWMLSEGTRRITAIFALLAMDPRPSLIAIEEIENGLDPWTLQFVLASLREASEQGVQILLTTHSPFLLDHVEIGEVIHVRRDKGDTAYEPITQFDDVVKNQGVVAPGAMYIAGYMHDAEESDAER